RRPARFQGPRAGHLLRRPGRGFAEQGAADRLGGAGHGLRVHRCRRATRRVGGPVSGETRTRRRPAVSDHDKLRRRDEIMAAAKKVFASNGFHSTTIADVAKEANLAYGSIYQYFDSKDDLFDALMSAEGYALRTHVAVALAATGQRADRSWEPLRAAVQA